MTEVKYFLLREVFFYYQFIMDLPTIPSSRVIKVGLWGITERIPWLAFGRVSINTAPSTSPLGERQYDWDYLLISLDYDAFVADRSECWQRLLSHLPYCLALSENQSSWSCHFRLWCQTKVLRSVPCTHTIRTIQCIWMQKNVLLALSSLSHRTLVIKGTRGVPLQM